MKKIISNSRLIAIALITVFTTGFTPAIAGHEKDLPIELKCVGGLNNHFIIQLNIAGNAEQNDFTIIIRNEYGNSIYKQNIKGENITKKFLFDRDELGDDTLLFEVFCRKTNKSVVYTINRQTSYAENIAISELR